MAAEIRAVLLENSGESVSLLGEKTEGSGGLKNIVYELDPERVETVVRQASAQNFGTLAGNLQQGSITNCAVYGANIYLTGFTLGTCGGLVGSNAGTIADCSAELVSLEVENCWAGGLVGSSGGAVKNSYAVGKITAAGEGIGASGLVNESNDGEITNCYAAVFLTTTDQRRGLCNLSDRIDENSGFLTGTFKYRGETYTVDDTYVGPGRRIPPAQLADIIPGLSKASDAIHYDISNKDWETDYKGGGKEAFPYLTGVKNAGDQPVHYGLWPVADATPALPAPGVKVLIKNGEELTLTVEYTVPKEGVAGEYTYIDNGEEKKGIAPTGALLGYLLSSVTFDDCQVVNTGVWGTTSLAGGMAGQMWASSDKTVEFTNCTAEGLTVDSWSSYAGGLLGWSGGGGAARFDNCKVGTNGNAFTVSGTNAGGLLGNAGGKATFTSCTVGRLGGDSKVSITKGTYVGGLVGNLSQPSEIDRCEVVNIKVEGNDWNSEAGGLVGRTERSTEGGTVLTNCTAKNLSVKGSTNAGGMLGGAIGVQMGFKSDDTSAPCSVSNVTVVADTGSVGGLVGNSKDGKFDGCTADNANVSVSGGSSCEAGGLVGSATGDSFRSCSTTNAVISAACFSGGLVGSSKSGGSFDQCTAANVRIPSINGGTTYVGGLVGFSIEGGTFTDCKVINAQMVPSATYAGGMVGSAARHALKNCQVYWDQSGLAQISRESYQVNGETAGGLVGTIRESGTIEASFAATLVKGTPRRRTKFLMRV